MLCAGITAYSPLVRNGCGPGKKVGVVGLGGIGHYAVMFAKALGAETYAISRTHAKEADAKKLGADGFIATSDKDWNEPHRLTFDLIVNTANSNEGFELGKYLSMLDVHGRWISVGMPEGSGLEVKSQDLAGNGCLMGASHLGSRKEMLAMLQLAADKGLKSWVEEVPISAEGLKTAVSRLKKNDVRYRFTMTDYDKAFGARE
jgi:alcohol dehydrogenase (NADP+)